jgi:hypothetical protein
MFQSTAAYQPEYLLYLQPRDPEASPFTLTHAHLSAGSVKAHADFLSGFETVIKPASVLIDIQVAARSSTT